MIIESGSFRDPSGSVSTRNGEVYRYIFKPGVKDFETAREAGVHERLIKKGLLIGHEEIVPDDRSPPGTVYSLRHPRLPIISYPWEWPFSMLKDAALLSLEIMEQVLPSGFWLRDANAFNVQYDGNRLCLIDTLSIGRRLPESPWAAYGQFCSHFLAPLAMAAYCDIRTLSLWRNYINGYPLDLAAKMLPVLRRYRLGLFMHLYMHARAQLMADRRENLNKNVSCKRPRVSDRGLVGLIRSLKRTIAGIQWKPTSRIWTEYRDIRSYQTEDVTKKAEYVENVVKRVRPRMVWDLGANTGEFSMIAAGHGAFVVSIDGDAACTEKLYRRRSREDPGKRILPLTMDLANPSPGLGWDSVERLALRDRGPADLLLALALTHHLVLTSCVPLALVASWLASLGEHVLVEFIPPTDPMVQKMLQNRSDGHLPYSHEVFNSSFSVHFDFLDHLALHNGRTLYLCKRRNPISPSDLK